MWPCSNFKKTIVNTNLSLLVPQNLHQSNNPQLTRAFKKTLNQIKMGKKWVGMRAYHPWIVLDSWKLMTMLISHIWIVLLHYINAITIDITFFNHLCLHCVDCDGSFKASAKFMYINNVPPSWRKMYIHTFQAP
jgi:hypothetical protein